MIDDSLPQYIFHTVPSDTPWDHLKTVVDTAHHFGD